MAFQFLQKIKDSLKKTRDGILGSLQAVLPFGAEITDEVLDEVEQVLYEADLGIHAAEMIVAELKHQAGAIKRREKDPYEVMRETITGIFDKDGVSAPFVIGDERPYVILVVGVNGAGKTTTIGKLATRLKREGKSVLIAACDTFRAAAVDQLEVWAERSEAEFIRAPLGADAASVAFDAMNRARARSTDVVVIDTAGRLHTSRNLMEELKKIRKVITRVSETAPHETLIVLDATTGQNALIQAETFHREISLTGIVLTKLDGTAKGGIVVSIVDKLGLPVKLIGIGEGIDDLRDFEPRAYAEALLSRNNGGE